MDNVLDDKRVLTFLLINILVFLVTYLRLQNLSDNLILPIIVLGLVSTNITIYFYILFDYTEEYMKSIFNFTILILQAALLILFGAIVWQIKNKYGIHADSIFTICCLGYLMIYVLLLKPLFKNLLQ